MLENMESISIASALIVLLFTLCNAQTGAGNRTFQVGVILDSDSLVGRIGNTSLSLALSDFYSTHTNYRTKLVLHMRDSKGQVIDAAASAMNLLKDVEVDAIIGPQKSAEASFVIGLGDRTEVPVISFSATSPSLHPQTDYFVQAAVDDSAQVGAISAIVEYFHWSQVVIIYEESDFGNGIIHNLSNVLQDVNARIAYRSVIRLSATDDMMLKELYKMKTMQTRVFVVHMSSSLASRFFPKVKEAGMMSKGYAWIVTSGLMDLLYSLESHVVESMQGVIGVKPLIRGSPKLIDTAIRWKRKFLRDNSKYSQVKLSLFGVWAYDALWALAMAAERVQFREPRPLGNSTVINPTNMFTSEVSETGPRLLQAISKVTFQGLGGNFSLINGRLEPPSFKILNVIGNGEREVGIWTPSLGIMSEISENVTGFSNKLKKIIFPGDSTDVPKGWEVPVGGNKLKIGVRVKAGFPEMVKEEEDPATKIFSISGCYIDTYHAVMEALPYAVPYEYLSFENITGSRSTGSYDDLAHQVSLQTYDGAVGDISITSNRSELVDFTLPFASGGVDMVMPIAFDDPYDKWSFLVPLKKDLWLSAIGLFIFTGLVLWILEHRFNSDYRGQPAQHVGMIFYFPFMSLVYAQREKIVTNSARLVVVIWVLVVLLLNSTYTASLSAILTTSRLRPVSTDANELKKNGDYVGCRDGAFIFDYVQTRIGFDKTKIITYKSPEDAHEALTKGSKNGGISAFFTTTPYTKLFLSKYCGKYMTVGPAYPAEGFAFAFRKCSPIVADVSRAIIKLTENGKLSEIEGQWMKRPNCNGIVDTSSNSTSIPLRMFEAPFAISGVITATCVVVFIATFIYKNKDFIRRISNSSGTTAWSKVSAICKHFDQRDPKSFRDEGKAKEDEETRPPSTSVGNLGSAVVVPFPVIETNDAHVGDTGPNSGDIDHTGEARPTAPSEHVVVIA